MARKLTPAERIDRDTPESAVQSRIINTLKVFGWQAFHDLMSVGNASGLPDIIAAHQGIGWILAVECKNWNREVTDAQTDWLLAFDASPPEFEAQVRAMAKNRQMWCVANDELRRIVGVARPANVDQVTDLIIRWSTPQERQNPPRSSGGS